MDNFPRIMEHKDNKRCFPLLGGLLLKDSTGMERSWYNYLEKSLINESQNDIFFKLSSSAEQNRVVWKELQVCFIILINKL